MALRIALILWVILVVGILFDTAATGFALRHGVGEASPLAAFVIETGGEGLLAWIKVIVTLVLFFALRVIANNRFILGLFFIATTAYTAVAAHHIWGIYAYASLLR